MKNQGRYFFDSQGEKRRHNLSYGEAFQRSEAEKEQVEIHKFRIGELYDNFYTLEQMTFRKSLLPIPIGIVAFLSEKSFPLKLLSRAS